MTPYDFLTHEPDDSFVTLEVTDGTWDENVYEDAYIWFTRDSLNLKLPITVAFERCVTTAISFSPRVLNIEYFIG